MNIKYLPVYKKKIAFTLIELLVVISIVGILSVALLTVINPVNQQKKARDTVRRADLAKISTALEQMYADNNTYPVYYNQPGGKRPYMMNELGPYMKTIPKDSISKYNYCYEADPSGQNYILCSVSEAMGDNSAGFASPSPCWVANGGAQNLQPDRYCVQNPF